MLRPPIDFGRQLDGKVRASRCGQSEPKFMTCSRYNKYILRRLRCVLDI